MDFPEEMGQQIVIYFESYDNRVIFSTNQKVHFLTSQL